jgi:hypothetical protein
MDPWRIAPLARVVMESHGTLKQGSMPTGAEPLFLWCLSHYWVKSW